MSDVSHQKAVGTIFPGGLRKMKIYRFVLRATLLFGLMGFTAMSSFASGPGTQPDPGGPLPVLAAAK